MDNDEMAGIVKEILLDKVFRWLRGDKLKKTLHFEGIDIINIFICEDYILSVIKKIKSI